MGMEKSKRCGDTSQIVTHTIQIRVRDPEVDAMGYLVSNGLNLSNQFR